MQAFGTNASNLFIPLKESCPFLFPDAHVYTLALQGPLHGNHVCDHYLQPF
jgi:hypothetical protein